MTVEPLFACHRERLLLCPSLPNVFAERGLTLEQLKGFELGLDTGVTALKREVHTLG